ncbi:hypothetical protein [Phenylobacterium sp.]|uniref:hypothetical protein n=1 Tax=Phenylobacterium sp. TaxID=1871053 RepID=UPI0011F457D3|nr:hypothetical protein [Phenylobacterium sp.]THD58688.1 MAG: hypothetical protein E8A49_19415 [Phenylobacterium sp.]
MRGLGAGVFFSLVAAAVAGPFGAGTAVAAPALATASLDAPSWAIAPEDAACHTDLELVSRSGAIAPVSLLSDGDHVALRFTKAGVPSQAFLPIRVDGKPFANLVQRTGEEGLAVMNLSDETLAALRRGKTLQVAWLSDEAVSASLAGASQGLADLKTCGAQVAGQARARQAEFDAQRERKLADARAKAVADEQLKTARAQTATAEAERQRVAAEAQRAQAQADELAAKAVQARAYAEQAQQQGYAEQVRQQRAAQYYYYNGQQIPPPPSSPPAWNYPQYYPR